MMKSVDDVNGGFLDPGMVREARVEELAGYVKMQVRCRVPASECGSHKVIKTRWIDTNKGDERSPEIRCGLVAKEVKKRNNTEETLAQGAVRIISSMFRAREWLCVVISLRLSTLHSLIFYFILLPFIFTFYVGRFGVIPRVRFREWGVWLFGQQRPSHRLWAQVLRRRPLLRDHRNFHPGVLQRHQALESAWLGDQWLHHRQSALFTTVHSGVRSQRAADKLITLLKKVCCQVSRCLSVMFERRYLLMSLVH